MNTQTGEMNTLAGLHSQLMLKDEVIAALTSQLEETAEKLERVHRSGAEYAPIAAALPSDVGKRQMELEQAIQAWQELQPAERLVRIQDGIDQILSLLEHGDVARPAAGNAEQAGDDGFWEAAKARILDRGDERIDSRDEPPPQEAAASPPQGDTQPSPAAELPEYFSEPEPPRPLNSDADLETLWQAIAEREAYIQFLTTRLRHVETRRFPPVPWEEINSVPDELKKHLQSLERQLTDHLKQAEIANSLERASLARERSKLVQVKQQLEQQVLRLSTPTDTPADEETASERKERRWSRFFSK